MPKVSAGTRRTTTEVLEPLAQAPAVEPRDIPPAPEDQSFWDWMQSTTAEVWETKRYSCYLYRLEPPAGKVTGEPAYLTKYVRPFTLEEVQSEFGGGKYMYWVKEGGMKQLYRATFRIAGEPKAHLQLGASDAAGLTPIIQRLLDARNSSADPATAANKVMEILGSAYKTGLESVVKSNESPKLGEIIQAVTNLRNLSGGNKPDFSETLMNKLIDKLMTPPDPLASLTPILDLAERFGGGGGRGDWRVSLAQNLPGALQHLKEIAHEFAVAAQANAVAAQRGVMPPSAAPVPGGPDVPGQLLGNALPGVATTYGPLPLEPLGAPPAAAGGAMPPSPPVAPDHQTWLKQMIVQKVLQGWSGEDLHGWLLDTAPEVIEELKAHRVEEILFYFGADPVLRLMPQTAALRKLVEDFLKFAKEEEPPKPN